MLVTIMASWAHKLLRVRNADNCRAFEICTASRLYNVEVDTDDTAKALL